LIDRPSVRGRNQVEGVGVHLRSGLLTAIEQLTTVLMGVAHECERLPQIIFSHILTSHD
jgi:hypothetical protein